MVLARSLWRLLVLWHCLSRLATTEHRQPVLLHLRRTWQPRRRRQLRSAYDIAGSGYSHSDTDTRRAHAGRR